MAGKDPKALNKIYLQNAILNESLTPYLPLEPQPMGENKPLVISADYSKLSPIYLISQSAGTGEENLWLLWLAAQARRHMNRA